MPMIPIGLLLSSIPDGPDPALALTRELHSHPHSKAEHGEGVRITIQGGKDNGKTWSHELLIDEEPSAY